MSKANRVAHTDRARTILRKRFEQRGSAKTVGNSDLIELFARMWIECDPNRGGPGCGPDEIETTEDENGNVVRSELRWKWFIPRAEASLKYLADNGIEIKQRS